MSQSKLPPPALATLESQLVRKYLDQYVKFENIGQEPIYGKIDRIVLDQSFGTLVVIILLDALRFEFDYEYIDEILTLI